MTRDMNGAAGWLVLILLAAAGFGCQSESETVRIETQATAAPVSPDPQSDTDASSDDAPSADTAAVELVSVGSFEAFDPAFVELDIAEDGGYVSLELALRIRRVYAPWPGTVLVELSRSDTEVQ